MKNILIVISLFTSFTLFAQQKGASPLNPKSEIANPKSTTRAVVIGISDYQDEKIPDLRFANRDAEVFSVWLQSPAGGSLPPEQVKLLTNEQATGGKVIAALTWLVGESQPGDLAIICFSGHGDVEQLTQAGWGYLLMHDAPSTTYMIGGAIPVPYLQEIVATLSGREVQVVVVSDACHAGKLAGSARGGTQATVNALAQKLANEIKILSCQPDEFSIEGEEWGGGRGCFSYHLVDALYGFADANKDLSVSLLETQQYLQNIVPTESLTGQMPFTVGNLRAKLATVVPESLEEWRGQKKQPGGLSPFAGKGMEDVLLSGMDSTVQELYKAFNTALERGDLLTSANDGQSANDYFERLVHEPEAAKLHGIMTRNLAAALQDEAQVVVNKILRTDPQVIDDAYSPVGKYDHLPAYLARAAELLGERHFMHRFLKAKEYFFRSKMYRKKKYPDLTPDSLLNLQFATLDTALGFDSLAAYLFLEKGQLHFFNTQQYGKAEMYFDKALALSPEWVTALYFAGRARVRWALNKPEEGIPLMRKAIELDSSFLPAYEVLGVEFSQAPEEGYGFWREAYVSQMQQYIIDHPGRVPLAYWNYYGVCLKMLNRPDEAITALLKGIEYGHDQFPLLYLNLGDAYMQNGEAEKAIGPYEKLMELWPQKGCDHDLATAYLLTGQSEKAEKCLKNRLDVFPNDKSTTLHMAFFYTDRYQYEEAIQILAQSIEAQTNPREHHLRLGQLYEMTGKPEKALEHYQKLFTAYKTGLYDYYYLSIACCKLGMEEKFREAVQAWKEETGESSVLILFSSIQATCGNDRESLEWLEKAFQKGFYINSGVEWIWGTTYNPDFHLIRETPEFKALVRKYLPDYYKD